MSSDLAGTWTVPLSDRVHVVELEHGTTTGKRVIRVDKQEVLRRDFMFKLVGSETFCIGSTRCAIHIDAIDSFYYGYTLEVNGKRLEKFSENQTKVLKVWHWRGGEFNYRIVLEKDTLDVWVNGVRMNTTGEFVEDGTETYFTVGETSCAYIKAVSSGTRKHGIVHTLYIDDDEVPPSRD